MADLRALARLVRLPAALTVPGDSLCGAAAAGWPHGRRTAALPVASACLYWAGMALNDYADRELDAVERPERPLPSGQVTPGEALLVAGGLTALGVGAAGLGGGARALGVALPLAATVWAYDLALKQTPLGPVAMGAARALDVLLGAGTHRAAAALPAALTVGGHALATTVLSRGEVTGARSAAAPAGSLATTTAAALTAGLTRSREAGTPTRASALVLAGTYAATVAPAQARAVADPAAGVVRRAVAASVLGTIPLQAALAARSRSLPTAAGVLAALPVALRLSRRVSPT